ncbi:calcitonin receptor-like [Argonauta hians]
MENNLEYYDFEYIYNYTIEWCTTRVLAQPIPDDGELYCEGTFDGWACWNHTLAGTMAQIPCPAHFPIFHDKGHAYKYCTENGTWLTNALGAPWTNYSQCMAPEEHPETTHFHYMSTYLMFGCFTVSIILLTLGEVIFFSFKQLRCDRITLHKNLFASYILTALLKIIYFSTSVLNGDVLLRNPVWCQVLHVLAEFAPSCNFLWMFCEGLYLYTVLVWTFRSGKRFLYMCCAIGWGLPLILTVIYAVARSQYKSHSTRCWAYHSVFHWITFGPSTLALLINIFFLFSIMLVLIKKLRDMSDNTQTRMAFRATMILIPLLGLQNLVIGFEPEEDSPIYRTYHIFSQFLISIQGSFVAILYCFWNGEVIAAVRRWYNQNRNVIGVCRTKQRISSYITMNSDPVLAGNGSKTMETDLALTASSPPPHPPHSTHHPPLNKPVTEVALQEETVMMIHPE